MTSDGRIGEATWILGFISKEFDNAGSTGFRASFNNAANYKPFFDFDGDGLINTADNLQFRNCFNRPLTWSV